MSDTTSIPLNHLPLRPSTLEAFSRRGFVHTNELEESRNNGGMANVAAELDVTLEEAANLIREVQVCVKALSDPHNTTAPLPGITTANDLLAAQRNSSGGYTSNRSIVTFCRSIDELLGGGISLGEVTEIAGMPGVGKTQLAMQLCVDARLPRPNGGVEGEAIYIDTEGSFTPERCYSMAKSLVSHVQGSVRKQKSSARLPLTFTPENILEGIHVYRVHDQTAQTATIHSLPHFLEQRQHMTKSPPVRLIIIDSIAFHYRCAPRNQDFIQRTRSLTSIADFLGDLATNFNVAVIAINQMTTKWNYGTGLGERGGNSNSRFVPALGESWAHATATRLLLSHSENSSIRKCTLVKSPHRPAGDAFYQVLEVGIRDIDMNVEKSKSQTSRIVTPNNDSRPIPAEPKRVRTHY